LVSPEIKSGKWSLPALIAGGENLRTGIGMFRTLRVQLLRMAHREQHAETMSIVLACDDAFAQHTYVTITSFLQTNRSKPVDIYILVPPAFSFSTELKQLERSGQCAIELVAIDPARIDRLLVSSHISIAAYYRLLMDAGLPTDLDRVLYLDSDIIILGDISPLWGTDLGGAVIGAAPDINDATEVKQKLGLSAESTYFNSGVMLIDLNRWREAAIGPKTLAYCRDHEETLTYWDQCALNSVLEGRVRVLDWSWNFQTAHLSLIDESRRDETLANAKIVHFTTRFKPWMYRCIHPFAHRYWKILAQTPWRGYRPTDRTPANVAKRALRRLLPRPVLRLMGSDKIPARA
jgi:lipopolysaccharide biosynthesis glycosyltransferase